MTIIATWGGVGSNCYVTHTDASSFIPSATVDYSDWTNATTPQQEAALVQATRELDALNFIGKRYYYDQALSCPREFYIPFPWNRTAVSSTNWSIQHAHMERDVKEATCLQALHILRQGGRNLHAERMSQGIRGFAEKIGPISESYQYGVTGGSASTAAMLSPESLSRLRKWLTTAPVVRA